MNSYILSRTADKDRFVEICLEFEAQYPDFKKLSPFEDKRSNAVYQRYEKPGKAVVIMLESLWQERIIAKANFDIQDFADKVTKNA